MRIILAAAFAISGCSRPIPEPGDDCDSNGDEICGDGVDNDCDGAVDEDCGKDLCGDGDCDGANAAGTVGENCATCPTDCPCPPGQACTNGACGGCDPAQGEVCGDGVDNDCDGLFDEDCPEDSCGDGVCEEPTGANPGETCETCPADCGDCPGECGDGVCNGANAAGTVGENCATCPTDCACPPGQTCTNGACGGCDPAQGEDCGDGIDNDCDGAVDEGCPTPCGAGACAPGEFCLHPVSCPVGPELDPYCIAGPDACVGAPTCECFPDDVCGNCATCGSVESGQVQCECVCICAAPDTPVATPTGDRPIAELRPGDLTYSVDRGRIVAVPILRVVQTAAPVNHAIVRVLLAGGDSLHMSPGHPTADGRRFGDLTPGERLDGVPIRSVETVPYGLPFTHDILPDSDTGTYFAAGVLVGSTLAPR